MIPRQKHVSAHGMVIVMSLLINAIILKLAFIQNDELYLALLFTIPLLIMALRQKKNLPEARHWQYDFHVN